MTSPDVKRSIVGLAKYGVTTERNDLDEVAWLRHAQEEALDLAVYLERLIRLAEHRRGERNDL